MSEGNVIIKVEKGSIAEEMEIISGDILLEINGKEVKDIFDYRYLIQDEYIELGIRKSSGDEWLLEIEKEEYEDIGIVFENGLMDRAKSCSNKCIFCFIDQLPPGMRETLYFKDDDSRLSFLQGNYVTLTNMKPEDLDRIIFYHLSPINISVHTTDIERRVFMLKNPRAANILDYIKKLAAANIIMNFQIVLCHDVNDGRLLDKTIEDLSAFIPSAQSISVVPFGMTKYRQGLYNVVPFDKETSAEVIRQIERWQAKLLDAYGTRFVYIADEFYLSAGVSLPPKECYDGFSQLEDGVGMLTLMKSEFYEALDSLEQISVGTERICSLATSRAAYDFICSLCGDISKKLPHIKFDIHLINNDFFGERITVSGLMTGSDIIAQLKGRLRGRELYIPENCLRYGEDVLLDDVRLSDIERELGVLVKVSPSGGRSFLWQFIQAQT